MFIFVRMRNRKIFLTLGIALIVLVGVLFYYRVVTGDGWERRLVLRLDEYFLPAMITVACVAMVSAITNRMIKKIARHSIQVLLRDSLRS